MRGLIVGETTNWDARYYKLKSTYNDPPREWLVDHRHLLPASGYALEAAMGLGANIPFLLQAGLQVMGVDRSKEAVHFVHEHYPDVQVVQADLAKFCLKKESLVLVSNFYYLEWELIEQFHKVLKPGGLVIFETLTLDMLEIHPENQPDHLLKPGELRDIFSNWDILDYREGWVKSDYEKRKAIASIIARKPV
jgi:tellurite methyltransferase